MAEAEEPRVDVIETDEGFYVTWVGSKEPGKFRLTARARIGPYPETEARLRADRVRKRLLRPEQKPDELLAQMDAGKGKSSRSLDPDLADIVRALAKNAAARDHELMGAEKQRAAGTQP